MKERDMQAPQTGSVGMREARAQDRCGPPGQERPAGLTRPRRRWVADVDVFEDLPMPGNLDDRSADGTSR
jgi:hypothetical protein